MERHGRGEDARGWLRTRRKGPPASLEHIMKADVFCMWELKLENCGGGRDLKIHPRVLRVPEAILTAKIRSTPAAAQHPGHTLVVVPIDASP